MSPLVTIFIAGLVGVFLGIFLGTFLIISLRFPLLALLAAKNETEEKERKDSAGGLCFGIAILAGVAAMFVAVYSTHLVSSGIRTEGVITEIRVTKDEKGVTRSTPVYQYASKRGTTHSDTSNMKDGVEYKIGDKIPVIYLADDPSSSRPDYFSHHWFVPIFLFALGLGIGSVPAIAARIFKRKPTNA